MCLGERGRHAVGIMSPCKVVAQGGGRVREGMHVGS